MTLTIHAIDGIDAVVEPYDWAFPCDHADEVASIWAEVATGNPKVFNGQVLLQSRGRIEAGVFRTSYFQTDYRSFLGYLRSGIDLPGIRNGFGMAALRSRDGAFLLGEMSAGTANAGKIYFAAGTPDPTDIVDGKVDIAGSVRRELCEETGLRPDEVTLGSWLVVQAPKRVAFMQEAVIDMDAIEARALILDRMRSLNDDELSDIVILRPGDALIDDSRLPPFCAHYIRHIFALEAASKRA